MTRTQKIAEPYEETREVIAQSISQLRKATYRIKRGGFDQNSIRELLKNAQRLNRVAQRTFRKGT